MSVRDQDQRTIDDSSLVRLVFFDQKGQPTNTYYCRPTFDDGIMALRIAKKLQRIDSTNLFEMLGRDVPPRGFIAKWRYFFRKEQGTAVDPIFHELETFVVNAFKNQFTRKQLAQGVNMQEMIEVISDIASKQRLHAPGLARPNGRPGQKNR